MFSPCMSKTSKKVSTGLRQRTFTFFTLFPRDLRSGNFYRRLIQAVGERDDWMADNPGAEAPKCHQVAACIVGFGCGNTLVRGDLCWPSNDAVRGAPGSDGELVTCGFP